MEAVMPQNRLAASLTCPCNSSSMYAEVISPPPSICANLITSWLASHHRRIRKSIATLFAHCRNSSVKTPFSPAPKISSSTNTMAQSKKVAPT
jgi:hypothetical protein